jgi:hypothetical protein
MKDFLFEISMKDDLILDPNFIISRFALINVYLSGIIMSYNSFILTRLSLPSYNGDD